MCHLGLMIGNTITFADSTFATGYSTKSEQFGSCDGVPDVPSQAPSLSSSPTQQQPSAVPSVSIAPSGAPSVSSAPSARPSADPCKSAHDNFRIFMSPGTDYSDISFTLYSRRSTDPFTITTPFSKSDYTSSDIDQVSERCIFDQLCMYVVVSNASGNGIPGGSFRATWQGKCQK